MTDNTAILDNESASHKPSNVTSGALISHSVDACAVENEITVFLSQLKNTGSDSTHRQYGYILRMFQRFIGPSGKQIKQITKQDVTLFLESLGRASEDRPHKAAYKRSSVMVVRAALTSFFLYMVDTERLLSNPMPRVSRMPRPPRNPIYLLEDEKDKFLATARNDNQRVIMNILVSTGMRLGELKGVKVKDIDLKGGRIQVRLKRGAIRQYLIIPSLVKCHIIPIIRTFIKTHKLGPDDPLIKTSRRQIGYLVAKMGARAGITKKISPHKLRHTFAVLLRKRGLRTVDLQNLLHHKNRETTAIYEDVDMKETEDELKRLKLLCGGS